MQLNEVPDRAGYPLNIWLKSVGISRPTYYKLDADCAPVTVKIGRLVIVSESPAAWLERMAKRGSATTKSAA